MGAALPNDDTLDGRSADRTRLSRPLVNPKVVLEFTAAVDPVDARPMMENACLENLANARQERLCISEGYLLRRGEGMQPGKEERFIGIDVA